MGEFNVSLIFNMKVRGVPIKDYCIINALMTLSGAYRLRLLKAKASIALNIRDSWCIHKKCNIFFYLQIINWLF